MVVLGHVELGKIKVNNISKELKKSIICWSNLIIKLKLDSKILKG